MWKTATVGINADDDVSCRICGKFGKHGDLFLVDDRRTWLGIHLRCADLLSNVPFDEASGFHNQWRAGNMSAIEAFVELDRIDKSVADHLQTISSAHKLVQRLKADVVKELKNGRKVTDGA